jgi:hypothetical protein
MGLAAAPAPRPSKDPAPPQLRFEASKADATSISILTPGNSCSRLASYHE